MKNRLAGPHIILSVQNPHVKPKTMAPSHEEAMKYLKDQGEDVQEINGKYGQHEKSILITNPKNPKGLHSMAEHTGQESYISSDGKNHKMIYVNGEKKGSHITGSGTNFFNKQPEDMYNTVKNPDGSKTHFQHNFDFDVLHKEDEEQIPDHYAMKKHDYIINETTQEINNSEYNDIKEDLIKVSDYYKKQVKEGMALLHPVTIDGQDKSKHDMSFHSTIKVFNKNKDDIEDIHNIASSRDLEPPIPERTHIHPLKLKDQSGGDIFAIELSGDALKTKDHNKEFDHMGFPRKYSYTPHITVDEDIYNNLVNSKAKTAKDFGIKFGRAELKSGEETLKKY